MCLKLDPDFFVSTNHNLWIRGSIRIQGILPIIPYCMKQTTNKYHTLYTNLPILLKYFSEWKWMKKDQSIRCANGVNNYMWKYIIKIDKENIVISISHHHNNECLVQCNTFLHNTKISTPAFNKYLDFDKSRDIIQFRSRLGI